MLARAGELPVEDGGWAYEVKWDGVRAIAYSSPGELRLESRNLNDVTRSYPELVRLGRALGSHAAVLDGEIVAFDGDGRPSFAALQRRMHVTGAAQAKRLMGDTPVTYMIFDLLWLDGHSLIGRPYRSAASCSAPWPLRASAGRPPSRWSARAPRCSRRRSTSISRASSPSAWTRPISRGSARRRG